MRQWTNEHVFWYMTSAAAANITEILSKQNWNHFLLVVNDTTSKFQISEFCEQIPGTETSLYICDRPLNDINVIVGVCALVLQICFHCDLDTL